jgi:hypothetical protein
MDIDAPTRALLESTPMDEKMEEQVYYTLSMSMSLRRKRKAMFNLILKLLMTTMMTSILIIE